VFEQLEPEWLKPDSVYQGKSVKGSLRIGPIRDGRPLASLWRIWVQGDEVYIGNRNAEGMAKISIHSSGKPFLSVGKNERFNFSQPMLFPDSPWRHIVELSFLIGDNILPLRDRKPLKPSKPALGIVTPAGHKLAANVLVGSPPLTHGSPMPVMMKGGTVVFQHTLRGGDLVSVVVRVQPMTDQDMANLVEMRSKLRVNTTGPYNIGPDSGVEPTLFTRSATTGNVITVVPAGPEVFTSGVTHAVVNP
jgi:hypothetical protein